MAEGVFFSGALFGARKIEAVLGEFINGSFVYNVTSREVHGTGAESSGKFKLWTLNGRAVSR